MAKIEEHIEAAIIEVEALTEYETPEAKRTVAIISIAHSLIAITQILKNLGDKGITTWTGHGLP